MCLVCSGIAVLLPPGEEASAPAEGAAQIPTEALEPTRTPRPTTIVFITSTPSQADELYDDLIFDLSEKIILNVRISGRDLIIQTNLDRSDAEWFFSDIGTIHGLVVRENPDVDRMILDDTFGQQIIIPMDAMKSHYNHTY